MIRVGTMTVSAVENCTQVALVFVMSFITLTNRNNHNYVGMSF